MIDKREFFRSLMGVFVEELHERVQALNQDLLALENVPTAERRAQLLKTLFRSLHSLKGAARSVNAGPIESACHSLEEVFTAVREGTVPTDAGLFALAFDAVDAIQDAGVRLKADQDVAGGPLAEVLERLRDAVEGVDRGARNVNRGTNGRTTQAGPPEAQCEPGAAPGARMPTPDSAPPAVAPTPASVPDPAAPPEPESSPIATSAVPAAATIRVSADKLDELLARTGELLIARRRIESRAAEIAQLRDQVALWAAQWRKAERPLRRLADAEAPDRREAVGRGRSPRLSRRATALLGAAGEQWRRFEHELERIARDTMTKCITSECSPLAMPAADWNVPPATSPAPAASTSN
jgi:two-component system, chemotaxis family, sensor kinase CheA